MTRNNNNNTNETGTKNCHRSSSVVCIPYSRYLTGAVLLEKEVAVMFLLSIFSYFVCHSLCPRMPNGRQKEMHTHAHTQCITIIIIIGNVRMWCALSTRIYLTLHNQQQTKTLKNVEKKLRNIAVFIFGVRWMISRRKRKTYAPPVWILII